jgi:hypothetical protein
LSLFFNDEFYRPTRHNPLEDNNKDAAENRSVGGSIPPLGTI